MESEWCIPMSAAGEILFYLKQITSDKIQYFEKQKENLRLIELHIASEYINMHIAISLFGFETLYTNLHIHTPNLLIFIITFSSHEHLKICNTRNAMGKAQSHPK